MKPIEFKEQTCTLLKPHDMLDEECGLLPVHRNYHDKFFVSCWRMGFRERIRALIYGKIWLYVRGEETQPPVSMICDRTVFE